MSNRITAEIEKTQSDIPGPRIVIEYRPGRWEKVFDLDGREIALQQKEAPKLARSILKIAKNGEATNARSKYGLDCKGLADTFSPHTHPYDCLCHKRINFCHECAWWEMQGNGRYGYCGYIGRKVLADKMASACQGAKAKGGS